MIETYDQASQTRQTNHLGSADATWQLNVIFAVTAAPALPNSKLNTNGKFLVDNVTTSNGRICTAGKLAERKVAFPVTH